MNNGESIRSEVSSRRRRRGEDVGVEDGDAEEVGKDIGSRSVGDCGGVEIPDSSRTDCS